MGNEPDLREYRGREIGDCLDAIAELRMTVFRDWPYLYDVQRRDDHPLRPPGHQPLDPVWRHFGYSPRPDLVAYFPWRDIGDEQETEKPLMFWIKALS